MTDYEIDGGFLVVGLKRIAIPDYFMDNAFTKSGAIDGRSKAGKGLKHWIDGQIWPSDSFQNTPQFAAEGADVTNEGLGDKPAEPIAVPESNMPRLGTHASAKHLVNLIAELYPDAKRNDWRRVQSMLNAATRYGSHWASLRKPGS